MKFKLKQLYSKDQPTSHNNVQVSTQTRTCTSPKSRYIIHDVYPPNTKSDNEGVNKTKR